MTAADKKRSLKPPETRVCSLNGISFLLTPKPEGVLIINSISIIIQSAPLIPTWRY